MSFRNLLWVFLVFSACQTGSRLDQGTEPADSFLTRFESEIEAFEQLDAPDPPRKGEMLFVGSSSIRLWHSFHEDLKGLPVLQRGVGGSTLAEINYYFDRLVLPYQPRAIFLYEGDNDLMADSISPAKYLEEVAVFHQKVKAQLPETHLYLLAVKPSPSRKYLLEKVREANVLLQAYCDREAGTQFVDIFTPMMDASDNIRPDIFIEDSLHMNSKGYAIWTQVIRPLAEAELAKLD